jgi:Protein of unknown function (DUF3007)
MRRIDAIAIGLGVFGGAGLVYVVLQAVGLDTADAGIWTQALLVVGLMGWTATYVLRAAGGKMTYHQQRQEYEDAVLQKRLDEMTPEELEQLQSEIAAEKKISQAKKQTQAKKQS